MSDPSLSLAAVVAERSKIEDGIILALAHLPRDAALRVPMSYLSVDELRHSAETMIGDQSAVKDQAEQRIHRIRLFLLARGVSMSDIEKSMPFFFHLVSECI